MRVLFPDTVPELDRETVYSSALHAKVLSTHNESIDFLCDMDHLSWRPRDGTTNAEPGSADCSEAIVAPALVSLMYVPGSSSPHPQSPGPPPPLDYVPCQPDSMMTPFLTPDGHGPHRRDQTVSDTVGSVYAWSSASPALSATHTPSYLGTTSPFEQPYDLADSSLQPLPPALADMAGFTPSQIDQLIFDTESAGGLYPSTISYPGLSPLSFSTTAEQPMDTVNITASSDHWLQLPQYAGPSTSSSPGVIATPDTYLSPSPSAIPLPSSRDVSASPTPTFSSDLGTSPGAPTRRQTSPSSTSSAPTTGANNAADLSRYGIPTTGGGWRCAHAGCSSHAVFRRGCDLRKHFNRHRKHLFCRHEGCPQSTHGGFSSRKDRSRHEAKHNPGIMCEWGDCGRVFSRVDNMKDHVRRIHRKGKST